MTNLSEQERKALAESMLANPLYGEIMSKIEHDALESCVYAVNDLDRFHAAERVKAVRKFRSDCEALLRNTQPKSFA